MTADWQPTNHPANESSGFAAMAFAYRTSSQEQAIHEAVARAAAELRGHGVDVHCQGRTDLGGPIKA